MKIGVGSKNPVKINAVNNSLKKIFPDEELEIVSIEATPGVSDQPMTDEETRKGALNRALAVAKSGDFDYSFGLEGGVDEMEKEMYIFSWVAVVSKNGRRSFGSTGWLPLPEIIAREIRKGGELGPVMDKIYQDSDIKKKGGAVGMYTNNLITRTNFFETAVILAMSKFIHESYY